MHHYLAHRTHDLVVELFPATLVGLVLSPFMVFVERYVFSDWNFLIFLGVLITVDTFLGTGYAIKSGAFAPRKFTGLLVKGVVYGSILIIGHIFENFQVSGNPMDGGYYLKVIFYTGILIVEATSIIKNIGKFSKRLVPAFILKRFEGFNETGDFTELTGSAPKKNTDFQSPHGDDFSSYVSNLKNHESDSNH